MIEFAQHIEVLLLENDCVIIPGFGGFIAHYAPAVRVAEENSFFPPVRTIGFNPQLTLNDGVLVQSYMIVYDTNFSDATKMVEKKIAELVSTLHEEGKVAFPNIGEIHYTIHGTYEFVPYDSRINTAYLYGFCSFEMKELLALRQQKKERNVAIAVEKKTNYELNINWGLLRNAIAMVVAVALFFFMSTPVENTYVEKENYAQILPTDLFEEIEDQSLAITPVMKKLVKSSASQENSTSQENSAVKGNSAVKEVSAVKSNRALKDINAKQTEKTDKTEKAEKAEEAKKARKVVKVVKTAEVKVAKKSSPYHIIIASVANMKDAEEIVDKLKAKGYTGAKVLMGDGKIRVSIVSCADRNEANRQLLKLRENKTYASAWMLVK